MGTVGTGTEETDTSSMASISRQADQLLQLLQEFSPASARRELSDLRRYARGGLRGASNLSSALQMLAGSASGGWLSNLLTSFTGNRASSQVDLARQLLEAAGYQVSLRGGGRTTRNRIGQPPEPPGVIPPPIQRRMRGLPPEAPIEQPTIGRGGPFAPARQGEDLPFGPEILTPQSSNVFSFSFVGESRTRGILYVTYKASVLNSGGLEHQGTARLKGGSRQLRGQAGKTVTAARKNEPGPTYSYLDVPFRVYNQMREAQSKGKFVWDQLRVRGTVYGHQYQYKLVTGQVSIQPGVSGVYIPRKATRKGFAVRSVPTVGTGRRAFQSSTLRGQSFKSAIVRGR